MTLLQQPPYRAPAQSRVITVAYTPDSDDAFNFYAWEHDRIALKHHGGFIKTSFRRGHISVLNHAAAAGLYDVVAVSSVMYPSLADRYWVLATGNSIGRGYGPVLVSKHFDSRADLRGRRVGVAELSTTGGALAAMYCPDAELVPTQYDRIADAIVRGELDAGVMIHEELLFFPEKGLRRVCDLGAVWCDETGLPLPVGLNLVNKSVGYDVARDISGACRESLQWAFDHYDEAFAFARRFGRGCAEQHVALFSNRDTLSLPEDARQAIRLMCDRVAGLGLARRIDKVDIIDG